MNVADLSLLFGINHLRAEWLSYVMVLVSDKYFWIFLYLPLLLLLYRHYSWRAIAGVAVLVGAFVLTDWISVHAFKNVVERLRPCHNPEIAANLVIFEGACKGKFGFVSSHAANTMCVASFLMLSGLLVYNSGGRFERALFYILPVYVLLNAYSRVYLGVHYPSDILGGWALGLFMGGGAAFLFRKSKLLRWTYQAK